MQITSLPFLILFLPFSVIVYRKLISRPRHKLWFLWSISFLYYSFGGLRFAILLIGLSLATFYFAQYKKFSLGIALNILTLLIFKYWGFGIENVSLVGNLLGLSFGIPILEIAYPIGISYYVFKHIGYLLDVSKERYPAAKDWLVFTTYSAFFLQINAGPISRFNDTGYQLGNLYKDPSSKWLYDGLVLITIGLAKKLLIADKLHVLLTTQITPIFTNSPGLFSGWLIILIFAMQLYFDFSGYTDLVRGAAKLFGINLPINFNNPYLSQNPRDFWERWHISLSNWFRIYLFIPLSRSLLTRWHNHKLLIQSVANMITMSIIGLWHGSGWGFVIWGAYHGLLLSIDSWLIKLNIHYARSSYQRAFFIIMMLLGWIPFLSPDFTSSNILFSSVLGLQGIESWNNIYLLFISSRLYILLIALLFAFSGMSENAMYWRKTKPRFAISFGIILIFLLYLTGEPVKFLYIQF